MLFEQFVVLETQRLLSYREPDARMYHWRTHHGAEVDLVVECGDALWAIEIKSTDHVRIQDLGGLKSFMREHGHARPVCVCNADRPFLVGDIPVLPWRDLFKDEWLALA